jgi:outer membrane protein assembly factor BamB
VSQVPVQTGESGQPSGRGATAVRAAIAAGLFALLIGGLLIWNYQRGVAHDPLTNTELPGLRAALRDHSDKALQEEIRRKDLAQRQTFAHIQHLKLGGAYLLVALGVALVAAGRLAALFYRRTPTLPPPRTDMAQSQATESFRGRWAVAVMGLMLATVGLMMALSSRSVLGELLAKGAPAPGLLGSGGTATAPAVPLGPAPSAKEVAAEWPCFRGPLGGGISAFPDPPLDFDGATGKGVRWKVAVPLPGVSSPVVWGRRVFVTGASATERAVYCFDADSGALLWRRVAPGRKAAGGDNADSDESDEAVENGLKSAGAAASTPATDGRRVCAMFATGDLACFDYAGKLCWTRSLGPVDNPYGYATSLLIEGDLVLVQLDQGDAPPGEETPVDATKSVLLALDLATGKTMYNKPRPVWASWPSPILADTPTGRQLITVAMPWVIAYEPATGKELWKVGDIGKDAAPSPAYADGTVYVASPGQHVRAIRTDGEGDAPGSVEKSVRWKLEEGLPEICSPVAGDGLVYLVTGSLTCYRADSGAKVWDHDLKGSYSASPTIADGKVYVIGHKGNVLIAAAGEEYKALGQASVGDYVFSCPAFAPHRMYVRGRKNLYCFESPQAPATTPD